MTKTDQPLLVLQVFSYLPRWLQARAPRRDFYATMHGDYVVTSNGSIIDGHSFDADKAPPGCVVRKVSR